jgi:hexosaminidase
MKKLLLLFVFAALFSSIYSQRMLQKIPVSLIPKPYTLETGKESYKLPLKVSISIPQDNSLRFIANDISKHLERYTSSPVTVVAGKTLIKSTVALQLVNDKSIRKDGYRLTINKTGILLSANEPSGIFYGTQTLYQLFPANIFSKDSSANGMLKEVYLPTVTINDYPRFGWRGLMLDVARHFFTVAEVKDYIDEMAKYKFNLLHLHLTDDQGWRIEIKSLPNLTKVGAWRVNKTGTFGRFSAPTADEPRDYGGFYTQDDIRELVRYAKERYINILPEIDVPGHSMAALASYPDISCTPGDYRVNSGEQFMIWPGNGQHFYGTIDNTICPANEKAYEFLDKVFTEVAALFPFEYIHMGGDETARNFWEKSDAIKAMMQKEKLKDLDEVQSYFVKRIEKIIESKGKKMIGWDEILQGGLAPNAAVMSWRGMRGGIEAVKQGHSVVMSPTEYAYIDYMQGDAAIEPPVYSSLRLKKAYEFNPVPADVDSTLIRGGQANLWTEQIYNTRHLQYMTWPRALAIAEDLWTSPDRKNWNDFARRVENNFVRMDAANIKYARSMFDPIFEFSKQDTATIMAKLSTEVEGLKIHYSFDNSFPDQYYPAYNKPLPVPKDAANMRVITYRGNEIMGRMITIPIAEMKKRAKIPN